MQSLTKCEPAEITHRSASNGHWPQIDGEDLPVFSVKGKPAGEIQPICAWGRMFWRNAKGAYLAACEQDGYGLTWCVRLDEETARVVEREMIAATQDRFAAWPTVENIAGILATND